MDLSYILNQLGEERDEYFGAVSPPVIQTSNFYRKNVEELRKAFANEYEAHLYTRGNNPTVEILRKKYAALAGAEDALVFSSGVAAISSSILSNINAGEHVVCVKKPYSWTERLLKTYLPKFGVNATMIDGTLHENFVNASNEKTKIWFLESPNTFTFELQDLQAVVKLAKQRNIITIIDNSYNTPLGQRAIEMGIDIETHTCSKYLGGHSDVVAGCLMGSKAMVQKIFSNEFLNLGGNVSPHDAWLLLRSLRTLPIRMDRIGKTAEKVVEFLENHQQVEKMIYPFSKSFPQYELAKKQMQWSGGLFSVLLRAKDVDAVETFCNSLSSFLLAVSWGGHESLVMPACSFQYKKDFDAQVYPFNLIRFYIGLEDADYLIEDLKQALKKIE